MIRKKLDDILDKDIQELVIENILERRTLEYKSALPDNSDNDKKEFLADISSFANTDGGDLVYGIREKDGVLQEDIGLSVLNLDMEIARLENITRDGISPRIGLEIKSLEVNKKQVLILRIKASMDAPHRVIFKGHDKFYKRNTNGKYPIDISELRTAFLQSSGLVDRIRRFRGLRIFDIKAADTPYALINRDAFIAIHVLPMSAFTTSFNLPSETLLALKEGKYNSHFLPFYTTGWNHRINLDGIVAYSRHEGVGVGTYTQLYRDGKIEAVECGILSRTSSEKHNILPMFTIEKEVMNYISKLIGLLTALEIRAPYFVFLSLVGVKDFKVSAPNGYYSLEAEPITQSDLLLPEVIIDDPMCNIEQKMRPIFDMIWNASGVSESLNFDKDGKFKNQA